MSLRRTRRSPGGWFIVLEGPDGCGKTTHARLLYAALRARGIACTLTREPGGTRVAEMVRRIILSPKVQMYPLTELLLYEAARAQHVAEVIRPALARGDVVVSDRFTDASLVYQGYARGIESRTVSMLNDIATGGLKPDLTIFLDVDPVVGLERVAQRRRGADRMERESLNFHRMIREGYRKLARRENVAVINTEKRDVYGTHREILRLIRAKVGL